MNERLFSNYKNAIRMLSDRGYRIVKSMNEITVSGAIEKKQLIIIGKKNEDKIMVYLSSSRNSFLKDEYMRILRSVPAGINHLIIIANVNIRHKRIIGFLKSTKYRIEILPMDLVSFILTDHEILPTIKLLSYEEKMKVLDDLNEIESNFPVIYTHDPVALWFGATEGQIFKFVKIGRVDDGIRNISYRIVKLKLI